MDKLLLTATPVEAIVSQLAGGQDIRSWKIQVARLRRGVGFFRAVGDRKRENILKGRNPMADMIISKSKTKETVKDCNVSGEFYTALDKKVRKMIAEAESRAKDNGRKTVRPYDL
jgi:hypothetical protein